MIRPLAAPDYRPGSALFSVRSVSTLNALVISRALNSLNPELRGRGSENRSKLRQERLDNRPLIARLSSWLSGILR